MAKEITNKVKLVIPAGQATPAPPIGPALSQFGINMGEFVSKFNEMTREGAGILTPVIITIYKDRSFSLELKTPPTSELIRREIKIQKGSGQPNLKKVGTITLDQIKKIAETKMVDLNTTDMDQAVKIISGTARQMGVDIV